MEKADGDGSPAHSGVGRRAAALSLTLLLIQACASGDVVAIVDLVSEKNADPFASDESGRTPLGVASKAGHNEVIKFLMERGSSALLQASRSGDLSQVKYLVEERHVDPHSCEEEAKQSPLHLASRYGHLDIVRYLVEERNCYSECTNKYGNTPLHLAALKGRLDTVKYLIDERGCDPMCRGCNGWTPLHCACQSGRLDMVKYLIEEKNVDSLCQDENGSTPLHVAAWHAPLEVVKYLIEERNCGESFRNKLESLPIHSAALGGRLDTVKYLINERGCDPMSRGENGWNPLHSACQGGRLDMVKYLIEEKNVNSSFQNGNGGTPLHVAAKHAPLEVVKYLIEERHCDDSVRDKLGSLPIHYAALGSRLDTVKYLINESGCDAMSRAENGWTPLHYACWGGRLDMVKYLIEEKNVDSSCQDENCFAPLHLAAKYAPLEVMKYLIEERRCDDRVRSTLGSLPIHFAAQGGRLDTVKYLINERGCDPMCRGENGLTPLHWACQDGRLDTVKYLIEEKNVDFSCQVKEGILPLHTAASNGHLPVVKLLVEDYHCYPGIRDKSGMTPGELAQGKGHVEISSYLSSMEKAVPCEDSPSFIPEDTSLPRESEDAGHEEVEESFSIFLEEAMKKGYVEVKLVKVIVVGPAGVGKTCLIYLLLGKDPPDKRHSTGCAERSIRVIRIGKEGEEWSEISTEEFMKMIAEAVPILYSDLTAKTEHPEEEDKMEEEVSKGGIEVRELVEEHEHEIEGMVKEGNFAQHSTDQGMAKDKCGSSAKSRREVIDDVIQRLTKLVGSGKTSRRLLDMEMIYLTDCGGQQAYWDLAPIFAYDTSATLFVHRLCEKLDEHPLNDLYKSGKRVGPEERARLTTSQAFKTMLQGLDKEENRSKIIVVGTHKDLLHECGEKPGDKNDILKTIASPHFDDDVVYCNESMDDVLFQMNTKTPNDEDKKEASKIRMSVHKVATYHKIPIWWFILQRILEALAEKLNRKVLTKEECVHVSNVLGFTEGELEAALSFLDKLNIFLYKKMILPDLIFTDAQVPLDKLSALVEKQYCLKVAEKAPAKAMDVATSGCKAFRDKGIVTVEFLKEFKKHYANGIFTANHFITLLEKLLIVSKLSKTKYFFPAILNCTRESQIIDSLTASDISPLVVWFPTGWAPPGVFCCSVCHLQTQAGWEIKKPTKRDTEASEETPVNYISRNSITFTKRGKLGSVTLIDNFSFFAVCVNVDIRKISGEKLVRHCKAIKSEVFDAVKAGLRNTHHADTSPEPAFVCPAHQNVISSIELHVAHISTDTNCLICDEDTDISYDLSPRQTVWLGGPGPEVPQPQLVVIQDRTQKADIGEASLSFVPVETSERQESDTISNTKSSGKVSGNVAMGDLIKLSTSKGRCIRILERSAMKYRDIGTILLKDDTGAIVTSIQQTALGNPVEAVRMIYERWIQENEDHSWKKLALCFGDVQLNPLARDIEQHFGFPSPSDRVTQVMDVPERDTSQDQQFSKEKDVPAMSLANPQDALIHQNRDTEHQAMVSRPEQLEVNETVTPMDTAASHHELRQE